MASAPWKFPVTQSFGQNAETGTDYGTPFHTPVPAPFAGTVVSESYGPYGGEVDLATSVPGQPAIKIETLLHLDQIFAPKGAQVAAGGILGLSGGQLAGGSHPAQLPYSTGPHTEVDFWTGKPFASASVNPDPILKSSMFGAYSSSMAPAATPAPQPSPSGPTFLELLPGGQIVQWLAGQVPGLPGQVAQQVASTPAPSLPGISIQNIVPDIGASFGAGINSAVTNAGHGISDFFAVGITDIGLFLKKQIVALAVAAVVLLILFS